MSGKNGGVLPSGKLLHNYGKSPFYSWENQLFLWQCSIAMLNYQRVMVVMSVVCVFWILLALGDDCDVPCPSRLQPWAMGAMAACNVLTASLMAAMTSQQVAGIAPQPGSA